MRDLLEMAAACEKRNSGMDGVLALYQRCTLKDDISYLLPT